VCACVRVCVCACGRAATKHPPWKGAGAVPAFARCCVGGCGSRVPTALPPSPRQPACGPLQVPAFVCTSVFGAVQMEQHLYTYLNQKYGLKGLIVEHASSIIRAANKFEAEDNDVAVFVRMLRLGAVHGVGLWCG
jgi:hypothetical protein